MKNIKRVFKWFFIFSLEKQERWLREMANKGCFFQKVNSLGVYTFLKGPAEDAIYKIDFNNKIEDIEEYYDLYRQSGWKYINQTRGFRYFRFNGGGSACSAEIYNDYTDLLSWLRKNLIIFLIAFSSEFAIFFTTLFIQGVTDTNLSWLITFVLICIGVLSIILVGFLNSYKLLKRKVREKEYKNYYGRNFIRKVSDVISLIILPLFICAILGISIVFLDTIGGSESAVRAQLHRYDAHSLYPVGNVDYIFEKNIDNNRVYLYGNEKNIGMIALKEVFPGRFKPIGNMTFGTSSESCVKANNIDLQDNRYSFILGRDMERQIEKIVLTYRDGSKKEISRNAFSGTDYDFMVFVKTDKLLDNTQTKVYDKDNADITDRYIEQSK